MSALAGGPRRFSAIVFDLDGTLIHSAPDMHVAANRMLESLGRPALSLAQVTSFVGHGVAKLVERSLEATGGRNADIEEGVRRFRAFYLEAPADLTEPYPHAPALLRTLSESDVRLGVCTNKPEAPTAAVLEALSLRAPFGSVVGGDRLSVRKPDPAPLKLCFEELGAAPEAGLFVGDSETDEATALALGVPFALFTGGYRKKPVEDFQAAFRFEDFAALDRWIAD